MTAHIAKNIQELTGEGIEYLVDETGEVIRAVFVEGALNPDNNPIPHGNNEITKKGV